MLNFAKHDAGYYGAVSNGTRYVIKKFGRTWSIQVSPTLGPHHGRPYINEDGIKRLRDAMDICDGIAASAPVDGKPRD